MAKLKKIDDQTLCKLRSALDDNIASFVQSILKDYEITVEIKQVLYDYAHKALYNMAASTRNITSLIVKDYLEVSQSEDEKNLYNVILKGQLGQIQQQIANRVSLNIVDPRKGSLLDYALTWKKYDIAKLLIENGVHISSKNFKFISEKAESHVELLELLSIARAPHMQEMLDSSLADLIGETCKNVEGD